MSSVTHPVKGIVCQLIACFLFAGYTVVCSLLTRQYPVAEILLFKNLGSFLFCLLLFRPSLMALSFREISVFYFGRGVLSCLATAIWLACFLWMPPDQVTAINLIIPLLTLLLAALFFQERPDMTLICFFFSSFIGVLLINGSVLTWQSWHFFLGLIPPFLWALSNLCFKKVSITDNKSLVVTRLSWVMTWITLPALLFGWITPNPFDLIIFIFMALLSVGIHYFQTLAYQHAEVQILQPFEFSRFLFVILLDVLILQQQPTIWVMIGGGVVFISNYLYIAYQNRQSKRAHAEYS